MLADPGIDEQESCRQCGGTYTFYERSALEVCAECGHHRKNLHPWYRRAACRNSDTSLFFPSRDTPTAPATIALAICATCSVREACLQYALDAGETIGVWGGTTGADRRRLRYRRSSALPAITRRCPGCSTSFITTNRGKRWCTRDCYTTYQQHPARRVTR